ncbi:hypothetical protein [Bradyrhizobium sp. Rc3b]|uniref:hypothetical protein n=1 Tax=Bradyrhizobium sp. Rc3b TaxID=1855322 RepID=UPI000B81AF3D|nr:hypothetical protein [Bradyrhizobium sp. Rc3b]
MKSAEMAFNSTLKAQAQIYHPNLDKQLIANDYGADRRSQDIKPLDCERLRNPPVQLAPEV